MMPTGIATPIDKLKWYVGRKFDRFQIAKALGVSPLVVVRLCRKHALPLIDWKPKVAKAEPVPLLESPITPRLVALAKHDAVAAAALERKKREAEPKPDLPQVALRRGAWRRG